MKKDWVIVNKNTGYISVFFPPDDRVYLKGQFLF